MAKIIETSLIPLFQQTGMKGFTADEVLWMYNGLDCCVTKEVFDVIHPQLGNNTVIYDFERAMQAPALEMMARGIHVDLAARAEILDSLYARIKKLREYLDRIAQTQGLKELNPNSPDQVKHFLYKVLRLPEVWISQKGERKLSTNREALEKCEQYFYGGPVVRAILACRDIGKKISALKSVVDPDGKIRTSYNVGATETGRWSSSTNAFGSGDNLQNWTNELRRVWIAPKGWKIGNCDLEQAESRVVAYESGDQAYITACESGDLHTTSAVFIWPDFFAAINPNLHREEAEKLFYRHFSRRDMSKRGGHAFNYYAKPHTVSRNLKIPMELATNFEHRYFSAFPGIRKWHQATATELQTQGYLDTVLGRRRYFLKRLNDDTTLREAIAYRPQNLVAEILNLALYRAWREQRRLGIQIITQDHDAFKFLYREEDEPWVLDEVRKLFHIPIEIKGRTLIIPTGCEVGWNAMKYNDDPKKGLINLSGLKKWKGTDDRTRPPEPSTSLLDRRIS